jgi:GDPmannose 4,6-dehydratase
MPTALITGISGQDGSYLAELLLSKGYEVHGTSRSAQAAANHPNLARCAGRVVLHSVEVSDTASVTALVRSTPFDEIYHLAAQTHVPRSFQDPLDTCQTNILGTVALLEAIRRLQPKTRLFHASSSLIFGQPDRAPQDESTPYRPDNPYAASKATATQMVSIYRKTYGLFAVNGICYNHESPRRGPDFVTGKICRAAAAIAAGSTERLMLGNIQAQRDWSDARDFVSGFWRSLQAEVPDDYVFASGRLHTVSDVLEMAFSSVGLKWTDHVEIDPGLLRPFDGHHLVGDPRRAINTLGWVPSASLHSLIAEMTRSHR